MATTVVNPAVAESEDQETANLYTGKVSTKVINPFNGKEQKVTGDFKLPLATSGEEALNMVAGSESDLVFWYNLGRKAAARAAVQAKLGIDLGSDEKNELLKSFTAAMDSMSSEGMSAERKKRIQDFILSEEKFEPIREDVTNWTPEHQSIDFAVVELKKPDSKRGPKAKAASENK